MTVTDQIKILNRKIKQNEWQYDLDRKAAEILALYSKNLDKSKYLDLKPSTFTQAKFSKIFNKRLSEDNKKELFKRLNQKI